MLFTSLPFDENNTLVASPPTADEAATEHNDSNHHISKSIKMPATSVKNYYDSEDDEETLATAIEDLSSLLLYPSHSSAEADAFQEQMQDPTNARISQCQNTYFMDGGVRFISLPTLGTSSTKLTTPIARIFEDWLANKLYSHPNKTVNLNSNTYHNMQFNNHFHHDSTANNDDMMIMDPSPEDELNDQLPILEDNIELLSEDIINMFKSRKRNLKGLANILIKVRTGHVYSYHQLDNGQPLITEDMEDFFQQFPLFVEILIYATQKQQSSQQRTASVNSPYYYQQSPSPQTRPTYRQETDELTLLLVIENTSQNFGNPYKIMETISL